MGGMTGSLLLLLWAGVSVSTMVDLQKRIINGTDCDNNTRKYHVQLNMKTRKGTGFCGGSLISDQWILTAAHCSKLTQTVEAILRVHPGGDKITEKIKRKNIHKCRKADIMLLKLTNPRPGFPHINLPDCDTDPLPKNVMVQIAGHASTTAHPNRTRKLDVVDRLQCANIRAIPCPWRKQEHYYKKFCGETTDRNNPVGACKGDSGGGVVYNGKIYGVISRIGKQACTAPDYYMGVCGYMPWIKRTMNPQGLKDKVKIFPECG